MRTLLAVGVVLALGAPVFAQSWGGGPKIVSPDGQYLGRLNSNRYDPDSVANPYGRYGSRYSPDSIQNPYGRWGSRYSPDGVRNPYSTGGPILLDD